MVTKIYQIKKKYITRRAVEYIEHTATLVKKTIYSEAKSNFCPSASLHLPPHHQWKIIMVSKHFTSEQFFLQVAFYADIRQIKGKLLYQLSMTVVTKYHKPSCLNNRNLFSQSSGGQNSEIQILADWLFLEALSGNLSHALPIASGGCHWSWAFLGLQTYFNMSPSLHLHFHQCVSSV